MSALTIALADIEAQVDASGRTILRWRLELRWDAQMRAVACRSTTSGLICDVQPLDVAECDWPDGTADTIAARIREELVRAKVAAILRKPERRPA
ncbi:MAG TPA: hypothetical protein VMG37_00025 [Solirubrobacteraceae bacterium]|nr:hypothetical protein [Solirubrobacteraceae bacterium]